MHAITAAILEGNIKQLENLLKETRENINRIRVRFNIPLGQNINFKFEPWHYSDPEESPLETAARINSFDALELLLIHGASAIHSWRLTSQHPPCALHWATRNHNALAIEQLLIHGENPNCQHLGQTCLHYAVKTGDLTAVQTLVSFGANLDYLTNNGKSVYEDAIARRHWQILHVLVAAGIKINPARLAEVTDRNVVEFLRISAGIQHWSALPITSYARVRADIRRELTKKSQGCSILPAISILPVSWGWKNYLSFGLLHRPENLKEMCKLVIVGQIHANYPAHMARACSMLPLPQYIKIFLLRM